MIAYYFGLPFDWFAFWMMIGFGIVGVIIWIGSMYCGINPSAWERKT